MNENTTNSTAKPENQDRAEMALLIRDMLHRLKRFWWVIVLMTAIGAALFYYHTSSSYSPRYVAEATVTDNVEKCDEDGNPVDITEHHWTMEELYDDLRENADLIEEYDI